MQGGQVFISTFGRTQLALAGIEAEFGVHLKLGSVSVRGEGVSPLHSFSGRLQGKRFSLEAPVGTGEDKAVRVSSLENSW